MITLEHFRLHMETKAPLPMPACLRATHRQAYNKGNVIRGGFGSAFRLSADRQGGSCVMQIAALEIYTEILERKMR